MKAKVNNHNKTSVSKPLNVRRTGAAPTPGCEKGIVTPEFNSGMSGIRSDKTTSVADVSVATKGKPSQF